MRQGFYLDVKILKLYNCPVRSNEGKFQRFCKLNESIDSGLCLPLWEGWLKGQCIHITVIVPRDDDAIEWASRIHESIPQHLKHSIQSIAAFKFLDHTSLSVSVGKFLTIFVNGQQFPHQR